MAADGSDRGRRTWLGWLGAGAMLLLAVQAGRAAFVAAEGERRPELAHQLWPSHPQPLINLALASIGTSARQGKPPQPSALDTMRRAGRVDPLGFQPLLVAATERLAAGDPAKGEQLLKAVLRREPRSTAAHFLLADFYVRQQRVGDALVHVTVLGRRLRGGSTQAFAGALATYLRDKGALAKVGPMLSGDPTLRNGVMLSLAQDQAPAAATALRAMTRKGDAEQNWLRFGFERLLEGGRIAEARDLLARAGVAGGGTTLTAWGGDERSGPLSWRLPASADGVVEAVPNGPLRLVFYGRADAALADHLLLLPAGRYRLQSQFAGSPPPGTFEWRVTCLAGNRQLTATPVTAPGSALAFDVPADCPAQRLALWGRLGEFPRTTSADLVRVNLAPAGPAA